MAKAKVTVGRLEYIALPKLGVARVHAKLDTGAYRSALHYQKLSVRAADGQQELVVTFNMGRKRTKVVFHEFQRVTVKSSTGQRTERYLVTTTVKLNAHEVRTQFTLFDRSDMKYQVLLGRKFMQGRFVVDVARKNVLDRTEEPGK
ncbi:MAG: ATP-dependent zinc protease [Flavobacteriales bacterium]|nr:ATP-dependent zinc protease [Flavobacteriales bacterium]MBK7288447.1 ATP-dependent zinc protease [Flavobacteriales bacterium]